MDISVPDFTGLTLTAIVSLTIILGLIDTAFAIIAAIAQKAFSASYVADFLLSHGKMWLAIGALALIGQGVAQLGVPAIVAAKDAAVAGLAAYAVTVVASLIGNARNSSAPA